MPSELEKTVSDIVRQSRRFPRAFIPSSLRTSHAWPFAVARILSDPQRRPALILTSSAVKKHRCDQLRELVPDTLIELISTTEPADLTGAEVIVMPVHLLRFWDEALVDLGPQTLISMDSHPGRPGTKSIRAFSNVAARVPRVLMRVGPSHTPRQLMDLAQTAAIQFDPPISSNGRLDLTSQPVIQV